jgi:hypothetical protein
MLSLLGCVYFFLAVGVLFLSWFLAGLYASSGVAQVIHKRYSDGMTEEEVKTEEKKARKLFLIGCGAMVSILLPILLIPREPYEQEETFIPVSISIGPAGIVLLDAEGQRFSRRLDGLTFEEGDTSSVAVRLKTTGHRGKAETWYGEFFSYVGRIERIEATVEYPRGKASDVLMLIKL